MINIAVLGSAAVGILVLAVIIMLGPTIPIRVTRSVGVNGGSMEQAMPALGATSEIEEREL